MEVHKYLYFLDNNQKTEFIDNITNINDYNELLHKFVKNKFNIVLNITKNITKINVLENNNINFNESYLFSNNSLYKKEKIDNLGYLWNSFTFKMTKLGKFITIDVNIPILNLSLKVDNFNNNNELDNNKVNELNENKINDVIDNKVNELNNNDLDNNKINKLDDKRKNYKIVEQHLLNILEKRQKQKELNRQKRFILKLRYLERQKLKQFKLEHNFNKDLELNKNEKNNKYYIKTLQKNSILNIKDFKRNYLKKKY